MHRYRHIKSGFLLIAFLDFVLYFAIPISSPLGFLVLPMVYLLFYHIRFLHYRKRLCRMKLNDIDKLSGLDFEYYLYFLFKKHGIRTKITSYTHDFGADLILRYHGKKIVIQAKRWNDNVGIQAVQETIGAKSYYKAHYGAVITNSFYTRSAVELAKASDIALINRYDLANMMNLTPKELMNLVRMKETTNATPPTVNYHCPRCGNALVKRNGKYGSFYGCSNYPECTFSQPTLHE